MSPRAQMPCFFFPPPHPSQSHGPAVCECAAMGAKGLRKTRLRSARVQIGCRYEGAVGAPGETDPAVVGSSKASVVLLPQRMVQWLVAGRTLTYPVPVGPCGMSWLASLRALVNAVQGGKRWRLHFGSVLSRVLADIASRETSHSRNPMRRVMCPRPEDLHNEMTTRFVRVLCPM
jgi:hypothetical protein